MPTTDAGQLPDMLRDYGVPPSSVKSFSGQPTPELIEYLDLVRPSASVELLPDGVAESQGKPLLYYVNASKLTACANEEQALDCLRRRTLGCRGQRAYLAVVETGRLRVVPVSLDKETPEWKEYNPEKGEAITFFSRLALGKYEGRGEPKHADFAFEEMFRLLRQAGEELEKPLSDNRSDVLSLIGRALFMRFLVDRRVVTEQEDRPHIAPKAMDLPACFYDATNTAATSQWLDRTFNGDFLPLSRPATEAFFRELGERTGGGIFRHLSAIMRGYHAVGGGTYQKHFDWDVIDFAHVPVGLLSQVYEAFCWKWEPQTARETSVHYTPRNIAATLVEEVFDGLTNTHECRVLDPACGGGVFLVLAFRRLYRALWEHNRRHGRDRPNTQAIRRILDNQLTGFEISEAAIRLAALSLYLTAVELDPNPRPPGKLKFAPLRNSVLFNFRRLGVDPDAGPVLGCLGEHVGEGFNREFDIILGNPPWTPLPGDKRGDTRYKELAQEYTRVSRAIISRKGGKALAKDYQNPRGNPDLPILWKSTEWCKADGRIAMALPARILLRQEEIPKRAREMLLRLVEVTGIINGSNLADTHVWPTLSMKESRKRKGCRAKMSQPFMLLFARNRRPNVGHALRLITPQCNPALNEQGEMWIDSKSALPVEVQETFDEPRLWKALAVGTALDELVLRKLVAPTTRPLLAYWEDDLHLKSSNGYQVKASQDQKDASFLKGLPDLNKTGMFRFITDYRDKRLKPFSRDTLFRTRKGATDELEVYRAPLAILKECPGTSREGGRALLALRDTAYNDSFNGYSGAGHPEGELLVRYLHLFVHSSIWMHYALLTSPKFGAERRITHKNDLDDCRIIPLESLTPEQKREVATLSRRLVQGDGSVFSGIDAFFGRLYGLDELDWEVINDTLEVSLPYSESRRRACGHPTREEQETFRGRIEGLLTPFFEVVGQKPLVELAKPRKAAAREQMPYGILAIGERRQGLPEVGDFFLDRVVPLAVENGQTLIVHECEDGLLVSMLNQYRYWTPSRARLLAAHILRNHMAPFEG